mgnify:FL=1
MLSDSFLNQKLPLENFDTNNVYIEKRFINPIGCNERIKARRVIDLWKNRNFPETVAENIKILDDYLTLCENNNVRPIMFLPPMTEGYIKYFSRKKLDELYYLIREAQKKHTSALFLDGWKLEGFTDMDFADVDHLNLKGAAKFSMILNNLIEDLERMS